MGIKVDKDNILELGEEHRDMLTSDELKELQAMQHAETHQEFSNNDNEEEFITLAQIKEILRYYE